MIRLWSAVSGVALLALFILVVYQEVTPEWKTYQRSFNGMEEERLRSDFARAEERLRRPEARAELAALERERSRLRARLESPEVQRRRQESLAALRELEDRFEKAQDRLEKLRADYQGLERDYILAAEGPALVALRKKLEAARVAVAQITAKRDEARRQADEQAARVAAFTAELNAVEQKLGQVTAERRKLAADLAKIRGRPLEIKQVLLDGGTQADRCTTCHAGETRDLFNSGPATRRRHPVFYLEDHPLERFGCALCHGGQPRATTMRAAHGRVAHWSAPLIPNPYLGGACGKCHRDEELRFEPALADGRKLFSEAGCNACHDVEGLRPVEKVGPDLSRVGDKVYRHWLARWLKNPRDYLPRTRMPNFVLGEQEIASLGAFLASLRAPAPGPEVRLPSDERAIAAGKKIFSDARCISCHSVEGRGGTLAPELSRIAGKVQPGWLLEFLQQPKRHAANSKMPRYRFREQDARALAAYMLNRFQDAEWPQRATAGQPEAGGDPAQGRALVHNYGCYGCHDIPGFEKAAKVGAELNSYADKGVERLDFGTLKGIPKDWFAWTRTKLKSPRVFRETLKMPDYGFSEEEVTALAVFLRSLSDEGVPAGYRAPQKPASTYVPEGAFGRLVEDLNCLVCHSIRGRGGTLAPDLTYEGSRVRREWLAGFLKNPQTLRLYMQERMPKFYLSEDEIETIVVYMKQVLVNGSIPERAFAPSELTPTLASEGRRLYHEKFACQACHQLGLEGGAIGPELTNIGQRLTEGWLVAWLKGSAKLVPNVKEPQYNMSDEEARAVAAFLIAGAGERRLRAAR